MNLTVVTPDAGALRELDALLLDDAGLCRPVLHADLQRFDVKDIAAWGNINQIYQIPTIELIDWLDAETRGKTIEICAGRGPIGAALGCVQTDLYLDVPELHARAATIGRTLLPPRPGVVKIEAVAAVKRYKPATVVAAWATELRHKGTGSSWGVDERRLLKLVRRYIMIGNGATHGTKRILKQRHVEYTFPWLVSRSVYPELDRIWVWG
jgi:hypothetical protein